jgi:hypothetical protein
MSLARPLNFEFYGKHQSFAEEARERAYQICLSLHGISGGLFLAGRFIEQS